jgi:hypothetical protein
MRNKSKILVILLILTLFFVNCGVIFPKNISTREDLMEVYIMSKHIDNENIRYNTIKKYGLTNKQAWLNYRKKMVELAGNYEEYSEFKKRAVDKYLKQRKKDFHVIYIETNNFTQNYRPTPKSPQISEEEFTKADKAYKAFVKIEHERERYNLYKLGFYENGLLTTMIYHNEHISNSLIKKEEYDKDGNITDTFYYND